MVIPVRRWARTCADFTRRQALSCLFPAFIFLTLALTRHAPPSPLPRYDALLLLCLAMQWGLYRSGLETADEVKVIALFHGLGLGLELYKTHLGAWLYPEAAWTKFAGVPLYSGFMYASVASYLCQAWRRFDLRVAGWPPPRAALPPALAAYGNFFSEQILPDLRWLLLAWIGLTFRRTQVSYLAGGSRRRMPLLLAFGLIGFFVWVAENIATYFGAWQYPNQHGAWHAVPASKISSWGLLVIVSFVIVAQLKRVKELAVRTRTGRRDKGMMAAAANRGSCWKKSTRSQTRPPRRPLCGGGWRGGRCSRRRSGTRRRWWWSTCGVCRG